MAPKPVPTKRRSVSLTARYKMTLFLLMFEVSSFILGRLSLLTKHIIVYKTEYTAKPLSPLLT
jgi:hypothetical protein